MPFPNATENRLESPLILVVEDQELMRLLLRRALEYEGYRVAEVGNGKEALEFYQQQQPDLVLLDAMMPVMDGFTCCQQLQALYGCGASPVLIVTSLEDRESVDRAFEVGAADYITKPIHWAVLRQRVRRLIEASQTMENLRQLAVREQVLGAMAEKIRHSLNLEEILTTTVNEVRQFLTADRVLIFRLNSDGSGLVVVESVNPAAIASLTRANCEACFGPAHIQTIAEIYALTSSQCQNPVSARFGLKANLVVPIFQAEMLWGVLIAHQCIGLRQWQQSEIDLVERLATQVAIAIKQAKLYEHLQQANRELYRLASLDGLTGVANRRHFDEFLQREWRRMAREKKSLSLLLFDIDYFKLYNDTYGHLAGDLCLQKVAAAVSNALKRPADLVARYGGEEFVAILPDTDIDGAVSIAAQIQVAVKALAIPHSRSSISDRVTISIGIATIVPSGDCSPTMLVAAADRALYQAKAAGRDRYSVDFNCCKGIFFQ